MTRRNAYLVPMQPAHPFEPIMALVLDAVDSPHTRRAYRRALTDFLTWHQAQGTPTLTKALLQRYRAYLLDEGVGAASINQRLAAIKKLVHEAADNHLLDPTVAASISNVPGAKQKGQRTGNWLTTEQAQLLLDAPDTTTLRGVRDVALLAVALGCGLRRSEIVSLTFEQIQMREGRWAIIDLTGKHQRIRSIPMPLWAKEAIETWRVAANLSPTGYVFRPLHKTGVLIGEQINPQTVHDLVTEYAELTGLTPLAPHDLRRTFAKLSRNGGAELDQIKASLGHASVQTTERYVGDTQRFTDAPADRLGLHLSGE
jgi:site-specific recombinase XerD